MVITTRIYITVVLNRQPVSMKMCYLQAFFFEQWLKAKPYLTQRHGGAEKTLQKNKESLGVSVPLR